jgi:hypothetical protein
VEVLGTERHARYRVRWLDGHESIHYPSDGTRIRQGLSVLAHHRLPANGEGAHRWQVDVADREPLEVTLQADQRAHLELTDEELHQLLPTALERLSEDRARQLHDIPWDEPVRLYADHFRG